MSRSWFSQSLETVATWWRIERCDGVTMGFTSHDRDLAFAGLHHRSAPGMVPAAVRRTATLDPDTTEVAGAFSHDAIDEAGLSSGRFDGARVAMGLVDWQTLEFTSLYHGSIGSVSREGEQFSAELASLKESLSSEVVKRTSPSCRAEFCGKGCTLSAARFSHDATVAEIGSDNQWVRIDCAVAPEAFEFGWLRPVSGADCGLVFHVFAVSEGRLMLERPLSSSVGIGDRLILREGCDHTIATCAERFSNAVNFQGEPYLPGNDLLTRYPASQS